LLHRHAPSNLAEMTIQIIPHCEETGTLYAHLFENHSTGLTRDLYWGLHIPCQPIMHEEEEWPCSIVCDWMRFPMDDWRNQDGVNIGRIWSPELSECSVYLGSHHTARLTSIDLHRVSNTTRAHLRIEGAFDLFGFGELDASDILFAVEAELDFEGVIVVPENFTPKLDTAAKVRDALQTYVDLQIFEEPYLDRFRYILKPKISTEV
jgi:hypothetical protein